MPLDTPLDVVRQREGSVHVLDGEALVAEARSAPEPEVGLPAPVTPDEARLAAARCRGHSDGRPAAASSAGGRARTRLRCSRARLDGRRLVASPWTPPSWTADAAGRVLPEFVWSVLDCPTYFALYMNGELPMSVLARLTVRIDAPVVAGEEHVVIAWPIETDGRKRHGGSAVLSPDGEALGVARALLIEPRER